MKKLLLFVLALSLIGCGGDTKKADVASDVPAESQSADKTAHFHPSMAGSLSGAVLFEGVVPAPAEIPIQGNPECSVFHEGGKVLSEELLAQNGRLQNAFIYIKSGLEDYYFHPPAEAVIIDNLKCIYLPHVAGAQVGQPVTFLNSDPTLHNVHSYSNNQKGWNIGLPFTGMKQTKKFEVAEVMVKLKCDVHPWMNGYIGVVDHPYFAVTGADGAFEIKNIPAGEYTIEVWHEKLGAQSQVIKIEPQQTSKTEFKFTA